MPAGAGAAPHCAALSTVSCYHAAAAGWEQEGIPGKHPDKDLPDKGVTGYYAACRYSVLIVLWAV